MGRASRVARSLAWRACLMGCARSRDICDCGERTRLRRQRAFGCGLTLYVPCPSTASRERLVGRSQGARDEAERLHDGLLWLLFGDVQQELRQLMWRGEHSNMIGCQLTHIPTVGPRFGCEGRKD